MRSRPKKLLDLGSLIACLASIRACAISLFLLLCLSGCSSLTKQRQEQDLIEAELRSQERHIQELKAEVERKEGTIHSMDLELEKMQQAAAGRKLAPGESAVPGVLKEISLGRLTGGFRNNPRSMYDDSLQFLIEPKDVDGHSIKVPGSMHIELFEITPAGLKVPLSAWDITHREVRRSWEQPLLGRPSYRILIPFKALPTNEKMRVVVRFTTTDGKSFEAEKDFSIQLPLPGTGPVVPMAMAPGGYSVVTPGHMINGTLVGPLSGQAVPMPTAPQPENSGLSRTTELPGPPRAPSAEKTQEPVPEGENKGTIPVIPFEPRKTPSAVPGTLNEKKGEDPPPLPPPPEIPQFNNKKISYELLPEPSEQARTARPLYPQSENIQQAGYVETSTLLTARPPESWRQRVSNQLVQVEQSSDAPIRLSRPVVVK